jgi:hypothetical protein
MDEMLHRFPFDEQIEPTSDITGQDIPRLRSRTLSEGGVPFTRRYKEGRASFYLPRLLIKATGNSDKMPDISFIRKELIEALFGRNVIYILVSNLLT